MRFLALTTMLCALFSVAACSQSLTSPCDVLVKMEPAPATAGWIVRNDRPFAQAVASHRGRYRHYRCG